MNFFSDGIPVRKRLFDLAITLPAMIVLAPVMGVVALLVWLKLGSPIFFRQARGGLRGKVFHVLKFRTMRNAYDAQGLPLPDSQRMTRLGSFLRAVSLDEIPELLHVLTGQMSLVGPRPLMAKYLPLYSPEQMRRHDVLPGITGWAQISGRNTLGWDERFALDVWYVDHWSLWLDLKILAITLAKVLKREGIAEAGQVTMTEFTGQSASDANKTPISDL